VAASQVTESVALLDTGQQRKDDAQKANRSSQVVIPVKHAKCSGTKSGPPSMHKRYYLMTRQNKVSD
jgi:hypothetical protein